MSLPGRPQPEVLWLPARAVRNYTAFTAAAYDVDSDDDTYSHGDNDCMAGVHDEHDHSQSLHAAAVEQPWVAHAATCWDTYLLQAREPDTQLAAGTITTLL